MQFRNVARAIKPLEETQGIISSNIANANTPAYKTLRPEMEDLFPLVYFEAMTEIDEEAFDVDGRRRRVFTLGQGARIADITRDMSQGEVKFTNFESDMAIQGEGYFRYVRPDGSYTYSRAGNLRKDGDGRLVNLHGHPLDPQIQVPYSSTNLQVDVQGNVSVLFAGSPLRVQIGKVMLAYFSNPAGLELISGNQYLETAQSGVPRMELPGTNASVGRIQQFALEQSNVNVVDQMMRMSINQRNYQAAIRCFKVADAIMKSGI
jgi:flagellar basal-body rod protein FlgG